MYQVLARKYRPKNFHQLLGQDHVAKALSNAITHQRLHHAYLFTGTRGVGKTTIARILAKCLNCETGITSEPCGVCATCQAIDAGRFIDVIEIDAASRTKVEDTRELLDNVPYAPTQGRYKVYLIDEVHMLSTHSFNALLKTLEEPPEHVKFLLATTDPQKLPITIISRCLQFVLRPLPQPQLADYLGQILAQEQISVTKDALWQLASSAKGSVRDALSLTDQAIAFGNGAIDDNTLRQMLGLIDQADVVSLLSLIYQQRTPELAQVLRQLREQVVDAKAIFDRLAEVLHQVALLQLVPGLDLQLNQQQTQSLMQLATVLPGEMVQLYYDIVVKSRENIALANTPLQALEMCLLRLLAFKPLGNYQVPVQTPQPVSELPQASLSTNEAPPVLPQQPAPIKHDTSDIVHESVDIAEPAPQPVLAPTTEHLAEIPSVEIQSDNTVILSTDNDDEIIDNTLPDDAYLETPDSVVEQAEITNTVSESISNGAMENDVANHTLIENAISDASAQNLASLSVSVIADETLNPLTLLQPVPQPLQGEWTSEKWDYWLSQARQHHWLAADELALANESLVQGQIGGPSVFVTSLRHDSIANTFAQLRDKLQQQMPGTQLTLQQTSDIQAQLYNSAPKVLQQQREQSAIIAATEQLKSQPVLQALLEQQAAIDVVKLHR